jgi:hypothetical protein
MPLKYQLWGFMQQRHLDMQRKRGRALSDDLYTLCGLEAALLP